MTSRAFDIVGVAVVIAWVAIVVVMAADDFGLSRAERIELTDSEIAAGFREGEEWQGIYLREQKVGYIRLRKTKVVDGYEMDSRMVLHLTVMKRRQKIETTFRGSLDEDYVLKDFDVEIDSGPSNMRVRGTVEGVKVEIEIASGGSVQKQKLTLKEPPRMLPSIKAFVMRKSLAVGDEHRIAFFDPLTMVEREVVITYRGKETLTVMDQQVEAYHLSQSMGDVEHDVWTNAIGEVLQEHLPMGLTGIRESAVEARFGVSTGTASLAEDVVDAVAVKPTGARVLIAAPTIELELSGLNFEGLHLDGGRQKWTANADDASVGSLSLRVEAIGDRQKYTIAEVGKMATASDSEIVSGALEPGMMIQSDNPRIINEARKIAGEADLASASALGVARKISDWVFAKLEKESVIGVPSAIETLGNLKGDCNEHATLTTALLRAVGVPARMSAGIAYLPDRGRFFYHAWVEVWVDGWIAIDPTFDQFPADVGHIRFIAGSLRDQMEMFRVIGKLAIRVKGDTNEPGQ